MSENNTYSKLSDKGRRAVLYEAQKHGVKVIYESESTVILDGKSSDCDAVRMALAREYQNGDGYGILSDRDNIYGF